MTSRVILLALVCGVAVTAGCADPPANSTPSHESEPTDGAADSGKAPTEPERPHEPTSSRHNGTSTTAAFDNATLVLSGCSTWNAGITYPQGSGPDGRPSGWDSGDEYLTTSAWIDGLECNRLSIGPFERGPIHLLWDSHDNAVVPPDCAPSTSTPKTVSVLNSLWVDDADVAQFLNSTHGVPVFHGAIDATTDAIGPLVIHEWTWGQAQTSTIKILDAPPIGSQSGVTEFLFWERDGGIMRLGINLDRHGPGEPLPFEGTFMPPMLFAETERPHPLGKWFADTEAEGTITRFTDMECLSPAEDP